MLPTLFNVCLSLIFLLSIIVITVQYVCKLRSPAHRRLPHTNSPRHRHSNAQPSVAVHHEGNPTLQSRRPVPLSTPNIPFRHPLTLAHGKVALPHPQHTWPPKLTMSRQPPCPCRTGCLSCQSFGHLISLGTLARFK